MYQSRSCFFSSGFRIFGIHLLSCGGFDRGSCVIMDYILSSDYANENISVIYNGHKVLVFSFFKEIFNAGGYKYGLVSLAAHYILYLGLGSSLSDTAVAYAGKLFSCQKPEKVTFADSADIDVVSCKNGNGGVAMAAHFFKPLTQTVIIIEICHVYFGLEEKSNIHLLMNADKEVQKIKLT